MQSVLPRNEKLEQIRRNYEALSSYPTGHSWKDFIASFGEQQGPFMLVLERRVEWNEHVFPAPPRERFFGFFHKHEDRKFGKLCFGQMSTYFGGEDCKFDKPKVVIPWTVDPKFLRTPNFEEGETPSYFSPMDHKVVELVVDTSRIDEELTKFIMRFISPKSEALGKEAAARMNALRKLLEDYFLCLRHGRFPELPMSEKAFQNLAERIKARRQALELEISRLHLQAADNAIEIESLK